MTDMPGAERARITLCFCLLFGVVLTLAGRLVFLQVVRYSEAAERVVDVRSRTEGIPAERCRITDRDGRLLAYDRPVYEAWGEVYFRVDERGRPKKLAHAVGSLVSDLMLVFERDETITPDLAAAEDLRDRLTDRIYAKVDKRLKRLAKTIVEKRRAREKFKPRWVKVDTPIHSEIVDAGAVLELRALDVRRGHKAPYRMYVHLQKRFERVYTAPQLMAGLVGRVVDDHERGVTQVGVSGLERLSIAKPRGVGQRELRVDARLVPYWTARRRGAEQALRMHTTLDLELQRTAQDELMAAVAAVTKKYGSAPEWGGMVAVDVPTGDLLAVASFSQRVADGERVAGVDNDCLGAFAPTDSVFEPGSVVKPLVFALGLQRGVVDWTKPVDCRSLRLPIERPRKLRRIRDSHKCGVITPREILIESSNIGAVRVGMQLGAEGLEEYLSRYRLRDDLEIPLPQRKHRILPPRLTSMNWNEQHVWTGPSLCYGYGIQTTVMHLARAYLTMISGRARTLRLIDSVEIDGKLHRIPSRDADSQPFLAPSTRDRVVEAMTAMVDGADGATAGSLTRMLRKMRVPEKLIAGKTGTSEFPAGAPVKTRTASFAGFAPARDPRVLVLCVLQKKGADLFYGGTYAAPAAGRLLLEVLDRGPRRSVRISKGSQVSAMSNGEFSTEHAARGRSASRQKGR